MIYYAYDGPTGLLSCPTSFWSARTGTSGETPALSLDETSTCPTTMDYDSTPCSFNRRYCAFGRGAAVKRGRF